MIEEPSVGPSRREPRRGCATVVILLTVVLTAAVCGFGVYSGAIFRIWQMSSIRSPVSVPFEYRETLRSDRPAAVTMMSKAKHVTIGRVAGDDLVISGRTGLPKPFFGRQDEVQGIMFPRRVTMFGYDGSDPGPVLDDGRKNTTTTVGLPSSPVWSFELFCHGDRATVEADFRGLEVRVITISGTGDVTIMLPERPIVRAGEPEWREAGVSAMASTTVGVDVTAPANATITVYAPKDSAIAVVNASAKPTPDARMIDDPIVGRTWIIGDWQHAELRYAISAFDPSHDDEPRLVVKTSR